MKSLHMHFFRTVAVLLSLAAPPVLAQQASQDISDQRPGILKALDGNWVMSGDVKGKPVTYDMTARPALQGRFTEMHMQDVQRPAQYEARVFVGFDASSESVIVHWMDSFGAKYSVPHATGRISGNVIQFTFPYQTGQFRDTFTYSPDTNSWLFVLESLQPDGSWKHFARYTVRRN